jgi:hypothetical protein
MTDFYFPTDISDALREELEFGEDPDEIDWVYPLIDGLNLVEFGSGHGVRTLHLSAYSNNVTAVDDDEVRQGVAQRLSTENHVGNVAFCDPADLSFLDCLDAIIVDTRWENYMHSEKYIVSGQPQILIVLGRLPAAFARIILDSGYSYNEDYQRGAVFYKSSM